MNARVCAPKLTTPEARRRNAATFGRAPLHLRCAYCSVNAAVAGQRACYDCRPLWLAEMLDMVRHLIERLSQERICKRGHVIGGSNAYVWYQPGRGVRAIQCRQCGREAVYRWERAHREQRNAWRRERWRALREAG